MPALFADLQHLALSLGQGLINGQARIEQFALLVEGDNLQICAELDPAFIGLDLTGQHLQQGGLAGTVRADERHPVAAHDHGVEALHDGAVAIALGQVAGENDPVAGYVTLADIQLVILYPLGPALDPFGAQGMQLAEAADIALAPTTDAVAQPVFLGLDLFLQLMLFGLFRIEHFIAPLLECLEPLIEGTAGAAVEPDHPPGQSLEEAAVVADQDEGGIARAQAFLEPVDHRQIEMVGRLIQQQDIGVGGQCPGERHPAAFPAREVARIFLAGQPHLVEQQLGLEREVAIGEAVLDRLERGIEMAEVGRLFQIADGDAGLDETVALIRLDQTGGDFHQGRLAGAVAPDQADSVPLMHKHIRPGKQWLATEGQVNILQA